MNKVELLSPAGNFETFLGALNAGADAIYLSGRSFGARAYADNFDEEELLKAIDIAHLFNKKVYLTLNTLIKPNEIDMIADHVREAYEHKLDGVIVQDVGVVRLINRLYPDLPIHLSTQLSSTCGFDASIFKDYNVTRIVPARELTIDEIRELKKRSGLEVECFIHGAMCYSYSGMCLFSSMLGGRSGNRGRCAQPCRLPYSVDGKDKQYILSMADMCTLNIIDELMDSGIDSFKIEGRMKKAVYSAGVTSLYRKYMDLVSRGDFHGVEDEDIDFIKNLYLRTRISEGYYHKERSADMICIDSPSYNGSDDDILRSVEDRYIKTKPVLDIGMGISVKKGQNTVLYASYNDIKTVFTGDLSDEAKSSPLDRESVRKQMSKTGDTFFRPSKIDIDLDDGLFISVGKLNEYRRCLLDRLYKEIIKCNSGYTCM